MVTQKPFEAYPLTAWESLYHLRKAFVFMERNGTGDQEEILRCYFPGEQLAALEQVVSGGAF